VQDHAQDDLAALGVAQRKAMARHVVAFAACWLGTAAVWSAVLVAERMIDPFVASLAFAAQTLVMMAAITICRAQPASGVVPAVLLAACVLVGYASIALFATVGGAGDLLAFILLTLYLAASLFFAWGWRWTLALFALTVVAWLATIPRLVFHVPTVELVGAIVIGTLLSLAVAERAGRGFRFAFLHRANEERARKALEASRDAAEAATRAKDEFIATLSHELRSP
jgi:signal transduction histidine kinase